MTITEGEAMFQLVIVDNSGYESEIVAVLPHQYPTAEEGRTDLRDIELHKPSDRFASWQVWSTDRIAGLDDAALDAATQLERCPDAAEHLRVVRAAVRDVWQLALQWQGCDDTEQQAGDIFTALSPLVAWEAEHLPIADRLRENEPVNDIEATGRCCCAGCVGMGPCARDLGRTDD